ncbi:hypothetical protein ACN47E_007208 [Coniothyrium glycines]
MNGQRIPGFYWDPDKKKYFKIQGAVASRDLNLKYSAANLHKAERGERLQKKARAQTTEIRKHRVVRRHAKSLTQTCAEREIGHRTRQYYAHRLWPNACVSGVQIKPRSVIRRPSSTSIRLFDQDPISKTVYAIHGDNKIKRRRIQLTCGPPLPPADLDVEEYFSSLPLNSYSFEPWDELGRATSIVSSLCYLPASGALVVTTLGSDRPPLVQLSDPERDGPYVSQQFTPKNCNAIWGAAARPTTFSPSPGMVNSVAASHVEHLAVAASSSMLLFTRAQSGVWDSSIAVEHLDSDILAVEWISYTTVALGCRNGKIHLYDTRSGGSSHVLTHPNSTSKIKRADDPTRLVCSGLQDTLFLYDIRASRISRDKTHEAFNSKDHHYNERYFKSIYSGGRSHQKRKRMNHIAFGKWSQPILSFPHANMDDLELGVDVHPRLGLIAAAEDAETGIAIRISNMWTGKTVKEFETSGGKDKKESRIRSLHFIEPNEQDASVDLWANWDGGIACFGW